MNPICVTCKNRKPDDEFAWNHSGKTKRKKCIECQREYSRTHYKKHKERHNKARYGRTLIARARQREAVIKAKDKPCADCGERYPYYVMQFDHVGMKNFSIGRCGAKSTKDVEKEILLTEVVCANCHFERTNQRRITLK